MVNININQTFISKTVAQTNLKFGHKINFCLERVGMNVNQSFTLKKKKHQHKHLKIGFKHA
jgi:hypothetical protein